MRVIRIASAISIFASVVGAQQTTTVAPRQDGKLQAEVHFTTDGSTWFTTNMPAYVALFDVSRTGVTQLYPTFSAQARVPAGTFRDVALRFPAPLPGGSALMPVSIAPSGGSGGWPHTLLLVASTAPLRVGNPAESNISLNNSLFQQHHFTDVETAAGINALVALVSPVDSYAEVVTDRIESLPGSVRALASSATYDPTHSAVGYSCSDATHTFYATAATLGATCTAVREIPPGLATPGALTVPTTVAAVEAAAEKSSANATAGANSSPAHATPSDTRTISDPAEIKRFMESLKASTGETPNAARRRDGTSDRRASDVNRRSDNANNGVQGGALAGQGAQAVKASPPPAPTPTTTPSAPKTISAPPPPPPAAAPIKP
jgi:hypothetical protein